MSHPVLIAVDSHGRYMVTRIGPESERPWWPTWLVGGDGTDGPRSLGNWLRFTPSDWRPAAGPIPDRVRRAAEWVGSIEDLDQVGVRDGRGWMPRRGVPAHREA